MMPCIHAGALLLVILHTLPEKRLQIGLIGMPVRLKSLDTGKFTASHVNMILLDHRRRNGCRAGQIPELTLGRIHHRPRDRNVVGQVPVQRRFRRKHKIPQIHRPVGRMPGIQQTDKAVIFRLCHPPVNSGLPDHADHPTEGTEQIVTVQGLENHKLIEPVMQIVKHYRMLPFLMDSTRPPFSMMV